MSEVKRYDMSGYGDGMIEVAEGAFVYFEDHQSELAALREELARSKELTMSMADRANQFEEERDAAEQRNAEDLRDANRYRYLRDPDNRDGLEPEDVIVVGIAEGEDIVWLEQMDQAVDVMMESIKPTESGASE